MSNLPPFPGYKVTDVRVRNRKVTVVLSASTACGDDIDAKSTYTARDTSDAALNKATDEARAHALRNLRTEHDSVVKSCKRRGTHQHGKGVK